MPCFSRFSVPACLAVQLLQSSNCSAINPLCRGGKIYQTNSSVCQFNHGSFLLVEMGSVDIESRTRVEYIHGMLGVADANIKGENYEGSRFVLFSSGQYCAR